MKRRDFLGRQAILAGAAIAAGSTSAQDDAPPNTIDTRVRQSVMGWCFQPMDPLTLAKHCRQIGLEAIEGVHSSHYPAITSLGLKIALVGSHGFATGPLDPQNHAEVESKLRDGIDLAVKYGAPNVITFTGMKKAGITDEMARQNCLDCWKRVVPYAEQQGIGIVLEHLNSHAHLNPDGSVHPMKGHPGYWGDDLHLCADLVRQVDSPSFKLLFDIYHVQVMHGDLIRNIDRYHELVGHYHTAGNPGRGELDNEQEINYPPVIRAIMETGYKGYIAQEFIPTSDDPIRSLKNAFELCNV